MSGSTSTKSNSKVRGFTVPSLSASLLPCVRVTVFSLSMRMSTSFMDKRRANSFSHAGGRSSSTTPSTGLNTLKWWRVPSAVQNATAVSRGGNPGSALAISWRPRSVSSSPGRSARASSPSRARPPSRCVGPLRTVADPRRVRLHRPRGSSAHFQGMSDAWITSGTPWPPTDLMARSTSFSPKVCVVTFSSGKRFEASCCSASSQAL